MCTRPRFPLLTTLLSRSPNQMRGAVPGKREGRCGRSTYLSGASIILSTSLGYWMCTLTSAPPQMHIVLELWGESGTELRRHKGFGRLVPQPTNHVRTLLLHLRRGLSYLRRGLGMSHTNVKLANILVIDKPGSLVCDIECKLADVGSVEEV